MPEFIIRDAMTADAAAICAAEKAVVCAHDGLLVFEPDELEESGFAERIASISDGRGKYLVVVRGSELLAHACLWPMGLRKVAHVLRLEMCVHLGHWHQGYGRLLLASLLTWARANPSALKVELLVRSTNVAAISLYRQFGFVEEGRLQGRIRLRNGQLLDDLSMALHIDRNVLTFEEFVAEPNNA